MSGYRDLTKLENSRNCLRRIARHDEPQFSKDSIVNVMERFVKTVKTMDDTILVPCRLMDRQVGDSTDILPDPAKDSTSNQHTLHSGAHGKRGAAHSKNIHEFLHSAELFNLYNMLKVLKNDLLWTGKDNTDDEQEQNTMDDTDNIIYARTDSTRSEMSTVSMQSMDSVNSGSSTSTTGSVTVAVNTATAVAATASTTVKGHNRRPSTASVTSTVSVTSVGNLSDSESEISQENDSGVESEGNKSDHPQSSSESVSGSEDLKKGVNADKAIELAKRCRRHLNGLYQCLEQMTDAANYLAARYQSDIGPV